MALRLICLEEHVSDAAIAQVVKDAYAAQAPYAAGIGSRYQDDPQREVDNRPRLLGARQAFALAAEPLTSRLSAMDAFGIDMQVVSLSTPSQLAPLTDAVDLARAANDRLAEAVARHPHRFCAFFTLPWRDPDAASREAERCVRELRLPATLLAGRPEGDALLDDPRFEPVLATLAALGAPLYVHPGPPLAAVQQPYYGGFNAEVTGRLSLFGWGWHHEAGIQVIRLILSGVLDRYRGLKLISGHWGEMVPFFLQRMDDTLPPAVTGLRRTVSATYRDQVWVTPSGMLQLPHFLFIREALGVERILFSVDYPYLTLTGARAWLEGLPISDEEKAAIAHRNAESLLHLSPG